MQRRIVVVGSINMDLVCSVPRLPVPGETLFGTDFALSAGGKGANQAVAVARLGEAVSLIGKVGSDAFGAQLSRELAAAGVDTTRVSQVEGASGVALIVRDAEAQNAITVIRGANETILPADIEGARELIGSASMVLTQLEIPLQTVEALAVMCTTLQIPLMLDPAPAQDLPEKLLRRIDWLTPNETEADVLLRQAATYADLERVQQLLRLGARGAVLKAGERGASIARLGEEAHTISAFPVEARDTTAAGDCFNAAFAVALIRGSTTADAGRFAAAAAAISVTRMGAQASMPTATEVAALLRERSS